MGAALAALSLFVLLQFTNDRLVTAAPKARREGRARPPLIFFAGAKVGNFRELTKRFRKKFEKYFQIQFFQNLTSCRTAISIRSVIYSSESVFRKIIPESWF